MKSWHEPDLCRLSIKGGHALDKYNNEDKINFRGKLGQSLLDAATSKKIFEIVNNACTNATSFGIKQSQGLRGFSHKYTIQRISTLIFRKMCLALIKFVSSQSPCCWP